MKRKRIELDAHKTVNKPTKVAFETKDGQEVQSKAQKPAKVPVRVSFLAKRDSN